VPDPDDQHLEPGRPETWAHLLGKVSLFAHLGKRDLRRIARVSKIARVSAGQFIVREGFTAEAFYILLTGTATVERGGGAPGIGLSRGDFFGELGLLDGAARTATVIADTDLWAARLPRERFLRLIDRQPAIARGLLTAMAERLRRVEAELHSRADDQPVPDTPEVSSGHHRGRPMNRALRM
jgi:CRP-like cAMP-binding protein